MRKDIIICVVVCLVVVQSRALATSPVRKPQRTVLSVAFSPGGGLLASGGRDGAVKIWSVARGRLIRTLRDPQARPVGCARFDPKGRVLASTGTTGIGLWDTAHWTKIRTLGSEWDIEDFDFDPAGGLLASGSSVGMKIWDVSKGSLLRSADADVRGLRFSRDGRQLVVAGSDGAIGIWDAATCKPVRSTKVNCLYVTSIGVGMRSKLIALRACTGADAEIGLWNLATLRRTRVLKLEGDSGLLPVSISPDGRLLAVGRVDGTTDIWNPADGKRIRVLKGHQGSVACVGFSPDGKLLASGGEDGTVRLWTVGTGKALGVLKGHEYDLGLR